MLCHLPADQHVFIRPLKNCHAVLWPPSQVFKPVASARASFTKVQGRSLVSLLSFVGRLLSPITQDERRGITRAAGGVTNSGIQWMVGLTGLGPLETMTIQIRLNEDVVRWTHSCSSTYIGIA